MSERVVSFSPVTLVATLTDKKSGTVVETDLVQVLDIYQEFSMDALKNLIGDGKASVRLRAEFSDKSYGRGISLEVSASITCDQSQVAMEQAQLFLATLVNDALTTHIPDVKRIFDENCTR
jgi:hypothetical protein